MANKTSAVLDTPAQLAQRYWDELLELVAQGEITPSFARRIRDDIFEPFQEGDMPVIRNRIWTQYVESLAAQTNLELDSAQDFGAWIRGFLPGSRAGRP